MLHLFRDRRRTKLIWIATAAGTIFTFVIGFNFLFGTGAGGDRSGSSTYLGSIYGRNVPREEFQALLGKNLESYRKRAGKELDDASMAYMRDQTWGQMVSDRILAEQARRLGLTASDREVLFAVRNLPPQELMQAPGLQTNGRFDPSKYRRALADPNENWLWLEEYQRRTLPNEKLQMLALSGVKVTDADLQEFYARSREKVQVQLVMFPTTADPVKPEEVTRPELEAYYRKHATEFDRDEEASLALALVPKAATPADERAAGENARSLYAEAVKDTSFETFAGQVSDAAVGRTLDGQPGMLVDKGQLSRELDAVVFGMEPGQVCQPVLAGGVYHIVKYVGLVEEKGNQKRHIIDLQVSVKPGEEDLKAAYDRMNQVREAARKAGLATAAGRAGLRPMTTGWFSEDAAPPLLAQMPELISFALTAKKGTISQVLDKPSALLAAQVVDRRPAGRRTLLEVEGELRTRVAQEKSMERCEARARRFLAQAGSAGSLTAAAERAGAQLAGPLEFTRSGPFPPQVQYEPDVVGASFGYPPGSVNVVRGERGAFVVNVLNHVGYDTAAFRQEAPQVRSQLYRDRQQEMYQAWMRQLQKDARVLDRRAELGL